MKSNSPPRRSTSNSGNEHSLTEDFNALRSLVFGISEEILLERLRPHVLRRMDKGNEKSYRETYPEDCSELPLETPKLLAGAGRFVASLFQLAALGDRDAVTGLKQLAETVSLQLYSFANMPTKLQETLEFDQKLGLEKSATDFLNDDKDLHQHVSDVIDRLCSHPAEELKRANSTLSGLGGRYLPITSEALFANPSLSTLDQEIALNPLFGTPSIKEPTPRLEVETMIELLTNLRLTSISTKITKSVASNSFYWPYVVNAIKDRRGDRIEARINYINLGSNLPIRITPKRGSGRRREFDPESQTAFALEMQSLLEFCRKEGISSDPPPLDKNLPLDRSVYPLWKEKALKLEPFSRESLSAWVEAGIDLAEDICSGDWESFHWAQRVLGRLGPKGGIVYSRTEIREKLRAGLESLVKSQGISSQKKL